MDGKLWGVLVADVVDSGATHNLRAQLGAKLRGAENPYAVQHDLQDMMQDLVGIVRTQAEMERALEGIEKLKARAAHAGIGGNREYNNGWHTALDLNNLLTVSEIVTRVALMRQESRGAHFRDDFPEKSERWAGCNLRVTKAPDGSVRVEQVPVKPMPPELKQVIEEQK